MPQIRKPIIAYIKSDNISSKNIFNNNGFQYLTNEIIDNVELLKYEYR